MFRYEIKRNCISVFIAFFMLTFCSCSINTNENVANTIETEAIEEIEKITTEDKYASAIAIEVVNLRGDEMTIYKLEDGTYIDSQEHPLTYNGTDAWFDENGVEWNEVVK